MLENAYRACLKHELWRRGFSVESDLLLPVHYDGIQVDAGYRADLVVERAVIVELKAVAHVLDVHEAQLLSYLRMSGLHVGLLMNFNVNSLRHGIRRVIN